MKHRTLIHSEVFDEQLKEFGDSQFFDEVLEGAIWAISTNPELFEPLPRTSLRFVRTIELERNQSSPLIPLKIWFKIVDDDHVELLSIGQDYLDYEN